VWCSAVGYSVMLLLSLLAAPLATDAQRPTTVSRIGQLHAGSPSTSQPYTDSFRQGLHALGYVEGKNLVVEQRWAEGNPERLQALAAELVRLPVAMLVAGGSAATRAAQQATRTIPIVMVGDYDPVQQGFVASLAQPGGNITGVTTQAQDLTGKQLELLKEAAPHVSRIAVLVNPAHPAHGAAMQELAVASRRLGVALQILELRRADEVAPAFTAIGQGGAEALVVVLGDPLLLSLSGQIEALAAQHRLPAMYPWKMYTEAGGLMSYAPSLPALWRRAAYYVDRLLHGSTPADLPVEQPTQFEFVINLKTAQRLGLTIPRASSSRRTSYPID
jgi:putative ABC transport system substrate-binding protein